MDRELLEKLREVAKILKLSFSENEHDEVELTNDKRHKILIVQNQYEEIDKFRIIGVFPFTRDNKHIDMISVINIPKSIRVSITSSAKAIAQDIERRLYKPYKNIFKTVLAKVEGYNQNLRHDSVYKCSSKGAIYAKME